MSRPVKKGLEYFPLDTGILSDRKIQKLLLEHGCEGLSVFIALICEIYGTSGYYISAGEDLNLDIGFTLRINEKQIRKIIDYCVKIRLFDSRLYEEKRILTSYGIQLRYETISKRNKNQVDAALRVVRDAGVSVTETPVTGAETAVNSSNSIVSVPKTSINRNRNKNGNKNTNKTQKKENQKTTIEYGYQSENDNTDAARRTELLQMAADATANS